MAAMTPRMTPISWATTEITRVSPMPFTSAGLGWNRESQKNCGLILSVKVQPLTVSATNVRHPASKARRVPKRLSTDAVIASLWLRSNWLGRGSRSRRRGCRRRGRVYVGGRDGSRLHAPLGEDLGVAAIAHHR